MNLGEIKDAVNTQLRKDKAGNALSPPEFNSIIKIVNLDLFKLKYGLPEEYQKGEYSSRQAWEVSRKISDDLRPFLVSKDGKINPPLYIDTDGVAIIPEDYAHVSAMTYGYLKSGKTTKYYNVECLSNAQFNARKTSIILLPDKKNPVCTFRHGEIHFMPTNIKFVSFDYLRIPATPNYVYTVSAQEEVDVYDHTNSTQFEWPEQLHTDIIAMILSYASDALRSQETKQSAELRKRSGV